MSKASTAATSVALKKANSNKYYAPAVETTARIFSYLAGHHHDSATLSEIADAIGVNRPTCHRVLQTLVGNGLVSFNELQKRYSLGSYLIVLGNRAAERLGILGIGTTYLQLISKQTHLTSVLVQRHGPEQIMYLAKEEPINEVHVSVAVGQRFPITAGSHGKCFLAYMESDEARDLLYRVGLKRYTDKSITDIDEYLEDLERVKQLGYAISINEHYPGIFGLAFPILDEKERTKLVVSCIGVSDAVTSASMSEIIDSVRPLVQRASLEMRGLLPML